MIQLMIKDLNYNSFLNGLLSDLSAHCQRLLTNIQVIKDEPAR